MPKIDESANYFSYRVCDPRDFSEFRWGTWSEGKRIYAIYGRKYRTRKWFVQALRFGKHKTDSAGRKRRTPWTKPTITAWVKSHNVRCWL